MITYLQNEADFDELIKGEKVVIDFYADWCGPCQMLSPVLEEAHEKFEFTLIKINTDLFPNIARRFGIMSIPTLLLFKNGDLVKKELGYKPLPAVLSFVNN
ncbi:MAG: thioredoxin [Bacilli bacterium]|nr:thioredoxin [Bacilli bacterium]